MLHRHAGPAVAGSYTIGAVAGAFTTSFALLVVSGLLSPIPSSARSVAAICLLALLFLHRVGVVCLDLPQRTYQIPRETFATHPARAAFRFAFELGMGVRTYITAVSPYALAIVLLLVPPASLSGAAIASAAAATGYGLGRSVVVASQAIRQKIAVEHPPWWLRASDIVALATAFAIAVSI